MDFCPWETLPQKKNEMGFPQKKNEMDFCPFVLPFVILAADIFSLSPAAAGGRISFLIITTVATCVFPPLCRRGQPQKLYRHSPCCHGFLFSPLVIVAADMFFLPYAAAGGRENFTPHTIIGFYSPSLVNAAMDVFYLPYATAGGGGKSHN